MSRSAPIVLALSWISLAAAPARAQFVDGDLYVSEDAYWIYRVDPSTWSVTLFVDNINGLKGVSASVVSPAGTLLCSNSSSSQVMEFDSAGNGSVLYDSTSGLSGPYGANGLAYDVYGDLYVSCGGSHQILRFPAGGGAATVFADSWDGVVAPYGLAFAANGDLYVANTGAYNVLKIDPAGNATVWNTLPSDPSSIVIRDNGDIYVATEYKPSIFRYPGGDVTKRKRFADFPNNSGFPALQLSIDGTKLYFTSVGTGNLIEIDADTAASNEVIAAGGLPSAVAITVIGTNHTAYWTNYGSGLPGTNGVPYIVSQQDPILGTTITVDVGNSFGQPTVGLLALGYQKASLHTGFGGDLLLIPALLEPISFSYGGNSYSGTLPNDPAFFGLAIYLQAVECDPGAVKAVSFTQGLELFLGW